MSRLVILVLFLFTLFLTITAQDSSSSSSSSSTAETSSSSSSTSSESSTSSSTSSSSTAGTDTSATTTVTVSSSSTGVISNGTNATVAPTATPTSKPTPAPVVDTGRAACPGNDEFTDLLKYDLPPWNCPRLDVDGGALGPRNTYDPCRNLTRRLEQQSEAPVTETITDYMYVCSMAPVAGLNSSTEYATRTGAYRPPSLVTKGDVYPIAIVTSNVLFNKKMIFQPLVDSFTSLEIAASHGVQWFSVPNTFISLEAGGLTSGPRSRIFRIPGLNQRGYSTDKETMAQNYWQNPVEGSTWRDDAHYGIVPFWTVLINVDNGRITGITWDEGCDACADQLCSSDGNCGVDEYSCALINGTTTRSSSNDTKALPEYDIRTLSDCARDAARDFGTNMTYNATNYAQVRAAADACIAERQVYSNTQVASGKQPAALSMIQAAQKRIAQVPPAEGDTDCGIKIYLGWTGTDKDGKYFTSAGKRLSVFRKYSIGAAFNSASSYVDQQLPEAPTQDTASTGDLGQ